MFIADASHQLQTPLTIMKLQVEQIKLTETCVKMQILEDSVDRMSHLIKQLLSLAKFEKSAQNLQKVLWYDLVHNVIINWVDITQQYNIDFGFEENIGRNIKNVYVNVDVFMLQEALNNLIDNAIKYCKDGLKPRITISIGFTIGTVWIKIIDNGKGIAVQHRKNLFDRFFRADTKISKGAGLGLAIVKEIIQAHHGFVRLLDEKETTFLVVLPRDKS
jgi:two-component system sensor histidine kinase TctE